jgi:hypothetical protein
MGIDVKVPTVYPRWPASQRGTMFAIGWRIGRLIGFIEHWIRS